MIKIKNNENIVLPLYVKLLRLNIIFFFIFNLCWAWAIIFLVISLILQFTHSGYRFIEIMPKESWWIGFYTLLCIGLIFSVIEIIFEVYFIKLTNKEKPIPKNIKMKFFLFPFHISIILWLKYSKYKNWEKTENTSVEENKIFDSNATLN